MQLCAEHSAWMKNQWKGKANRAVVPGAASVWHSVTSCIPLPSTLGSLLPSMLMSSLGAGAERTIRQFTHETQLGGDLGSLK